MEQRKQLRFGGDRLIDPQYCNFPSAITRGPLHGHPGDIAVVVSKEEAKELRDELYRRLTPNALGWSEEEVQHYSTFGGKKLILENEAFGYVTRGQGVIEDSKLDPRKVVSLRKKRVARKPVVQTTEE